MIPEIPSAPTRRRRVLLGQLGANGDCVYATTIARQIKVDFPGCHLTWAIGSMCRNVIEHNPHVDDVWEIELRGHDQMIEAWRNFAREARRRQRQGDFHDVYFTQIFPDNFRHYDGTVRASIFRGYPRAITVPVTPVIRLNAGEIDRVHAFAARHGLKAGGSAILFEASPRSKQSPMTPSWAATMARRIVEARPDCRIVWASRPDADVRLAGAVDASELAFRDIATLARYCSLFVGCSSGLTWLLTSDAAPKLPTIQILSGHVGDYGAVVRDLEHWGLPSDHVIELHDCTPELAATCAVEVLSGGVAPARAAYHETLPLRFGAYYEIMLPYLRQGHVRTFVESLAHTIRRYGFRRELLRDFVEQVRPMLARRLSLE